MNPRFTESFGRLQYICVILSIPDYVFVATSVLAKITIIFAVSAEIEKTVQENLVAKHIAAN